MARADGVLDPLGKPRAERRRAARAQPGLLTSQGDVGKLANAGPRGLADTSGLKYGVVHLAAYNLGVTRGSKLNGAEGGE
jgi:hypothetical protein